jgi:hypothetical protein
MAKFSGAKPAAQSRSLRSIAERNTGDFPDDVDQAAPPYEDQAEQAKPTGSTSQAASTTIPFANLRGGRS